MIYHPTEQVSHGFAEKIIENEGETIKIIVLNPNQDNAIIYFGGNAENVVYSTLDFLQLTSNTVYLVNYRGYSGSTGKPTEDGLYSDALALYDNIATNHTNISVIGRSIGSGVATLLASQRPVSKLMLATPFDSLQNIAQAKFWIYPLSIILLDKYKSIDRVKDINAETLILIAENDQLVPYKNTEHLVDAFPEEQVSVKIIKNRGHNDISNSIEYMNALNSFFSTY
jgi:fermentation-respiration switch protein FrsA (DUF1100 family)